MGPEESSIGRRNFLQMMGAGFVAAGTGATATQALASNASVNSETSAGALADLVRGECRLPAHLHAPRLGAFAAFASLGHSLVIDALRFAPFGQSASTTGARGAYPHCGGPMRGKHVVDKLSRQLAEGEGKCTGTRKLSGN